MTFTLTNIVFANAALLAMLLVLQPLVRDIKVGIAYTVGNFDERRDEGVFARRLIMVVRNQIEATVVFLPVVLLALPLTETPDKLVSACTLFIGARIVYVLVALAGIPILRSGAWAVGFIASLWANWLVWAAL